MTRQKGTTWRRRVARPWIVGGAVAALLIIAAVATAPGGRSDPTTVSNSIVLSFASDGGASCTVELRPVVRTAHPAAWSIVRGYLATADAPAVDIPSLIRGGAVGEAEVAALSTGLSSRAEQELFRRLGFRIHVTLVSDYSCDAAADVVGFFRASTGQICEIQLSVDPDWGSGATEDDGAVAARTYLTTIDFTQVDYSAALRDLADFWPDGHDPGAAEAAALAQTLTRQAHASFDTTRTASLPIRIESWTRCDPALDP